jgi:hypothetical protein
MNIPTIKPRQNIRPLLSEYIRIFFPNDFNSEGAIISGFVTAIIIYFSVAGLRPKSGYKGLGIPGGVGGYPF